MRRFSHQFFQGAKKKLQGCRRKSTNDPGARYVNVKKTRGKLTHRRLPKVSKHVSFFFGGGDDFA